MSMSQDARCPECGTLHAGPGEYESYTTSPGQADVPFGCAELTHTYMLRTYGGHGPGASDTLVITAGVPQIDSFSVTPVGTCADPTALFETTGGYGPPARQPETILEPRSLTHRPTWAQFTISHGERKQRSFRTG